MPNFEVVSKFKPQGDQPQAIEKLVAGVVEGHKYQTLMGATGTGKTFTMAHTVARLGRPALVISHNKTLAAQLYEEFKDLSPPNQTPRPQPLQTLQTPPPPQPRRLLPLLLRLLPARSLPPPARHLHRK